MSVAADQVGLAETAPSASSTPTASTAAALGPGSASAKKDGVV